MKLKLALLFLASVALLCADAFTVSIVYQDDAGCRSVERMFPTMTLPGLCRPNVQFAVYSERAAAFVVGIATTERLIVRTVAVQAGRASVFVQLDGGERYLAYSVSEVLP